MRPLGGPERRRTTNRHAAATVRTPPSSLGPGTGLLTLPTRSSCDDEKGLPFLALATGRQHGGFRRVRGARPTRDPIWHRSGAAYAGFLFHCYSRPGRESVRLGVP